MHKGHEEKKIEIRLCVLRASSVNLRDLHSSMHGQDGNGNPFLKGNGEFPCGTSNTGTLW